MRRNVFLAIKIHLLAGRLRLKILPPRWQGSRCEHSVRVQRTEPSAQVAEVAMLALRAFRPRSAGGPNRRAQGENSAAPLNAARRLAARAVPPPSLSPFRFPLSAFRF